ncbi:MAG: sensor histidine kinase [Bacteroidales bacterium]|jgi:signal transduction histidine kinase|nr:sensor histidine kinase [Bacteroidales bacterium]
MLKPILFVLIVILFLFGCNSSKKNTVVQQVDNEVIEIDTLFTSTTDSLEYVVKKGSIEAKLQALSDLTWYFQNCDISKALNYAWQQKDLAKQYNKAEWLADAFENLGGIYLYEQQADSTEYYFMSAYDLWTTLDNRNRIGACLVNLSSTMRLYMMPDSALKLLFQALIIFEEEENDSYLAQTLSNIAGIYNDIGNYSKHDEYAFQALAIQESMDKSSALGVTLTNLCLSMKAQCRFDEAIEYGEHAIQVFKEIDHPYFVCMALTRVSEALFEKGKNEDAIKYTDEAISYAEEIGSTQLKIEALRARAHYYLQSGLHNKAKIDAEEALVLIDTSNASKMEQVYIFDLLTTISICTNEKADIQKYLQKYIEIKNIVQQEQWIEQISEMETKYSSEKKELQINALEKEKRLYSLLSIIGSIVLCLILVVFFSLWRLNLQKRRVFEQQKLLAEQQLKQIEQEKIIISAQALLDGENSERRRIAKDLHDGLGSMLSLVKLTLPKINNPEVVTIDKEERFQKAFIMLDNSIKELRRIAHHMMPESLMQYGIKTSLSDFCCSSTNVNFHYFGNDMRMDSKLEIMLYRIAHELINNALKHAEATNINVQLIQEENRVSLTVCDNGKGFDTNIKRNGMGLNNILNRVETYGGRLTLFSSPGNGTEVNIEITKL